MADSDLFSGLPSGWTFRVRERSSGVYEVIATSPTGQAATRSGTDLASLADEVVADSWAIAEAFADDVENGH